MLAELLWLWFCLRPEAGNKFAPRALHLSPRQDRGVLRRRKPKTARYADFKNTNYNAPRGKTTGNRKLNKITFDSIG